jgi:nitrogen regulatory protein P-II 1
MKRIDAIIRQHMLENVKDALTQMGIAGMTVTEVRGFGRQKGQTEMYRGVEYRVDFVPKLLISLFVSDVQAPAVVDTIIHTARTGEMGEGKIGDGKIAVYQLEDLVRVRTGESGEDAL